MEEENVDVVDLHALEASVDALFEQSGYVGWWNVAHAAFGGDADAVGKGTVERFTDDTLGLAIAVGGGHVQ